MCEKCRTTTSSAEVNTAAVGAAYGANSSHTVDSEINRFREFTKDAVVTNRPAYSLGAPISDGKGYGIGYKDVNGVNRGFILPIEIAEEMAHAMLQEIEHIKTKSARQKLAAALDRMAGYVRGGTAINDVIEEMADIVAAA